MAQTTVLTAFRYNGKMGKGFSRIDRSLKRAQAEVRNAITPHNRTKQHRLRCTYPECTN